MKELPLVADASGDNEAGWRPVVKCGSEVIWEGQTSYPQRTDAVEAAERTTKKALGVALTSHEVIIRDLRDRFQR
jgi:hypothetical protein